MYPNIQNILAEFEVKLRLQCYVPARRKTYKNALAKFLSHFIQEDLALLTVPKLPVTFLLSSKERILVRTINGKF